MATTRAKTDLTIAGHPISDPDLPDIVGQLPAQPKAEIAANFTLGTQFHLGQVSIKGSVPADARDKLGLAAGAPAVAADVLAARDRLLNAIRDDGYPHGQGRPAARHPAPRRQRD